MVGGVPILINKSSSIFAIDEIAHQHETASKPRYGKLARTLKRLVPTIFCNIRADKHYAELARLLVERNPKPVVLVIGGATEGEGLRRILLDPGIRLVETDIYFGPRTTLICDAHDVPFQEATFDGVVIQEVLEHVVDPFRCADEIHRVLKPGGLVYAETAFMQAVHEGRYDFMRFTDLGHRRLFRRFQEIHRGAVAGPGTALAWAYRSFLLSFASSSALQLALRAFAHFTSFWLKYFDYLLANTRSGLDGACQLYFLGRKSDETLGDKELLTLYRGCNQSGVPL